MWEPRELEAHCLFTYDLHQSGFKGLQRDLSLKGK